MPKIHQLRREQVVATDLNTAWEFIQSPNNLDKITPDDMDFEIVSNLPEQMYNGLLIEYRVGVPFMGKQTWLTELKHIKERHSFVDEQRIGPYKLWYHYHEIAAVDGGVKFSDCVTYIMPFGPIGELARAIFVKRQLASIFDHRHVAMEQLLSKS